MALGFLPPLERTAAVFQHQTTQKQQKCTAALQPCCERICRNSCCVTQAGGCPTPGYNLTLDITYDQFPTLQVQLHTASDAIAPPAFTPAAALICSCSSFPHTRSMGLTVSSLVVDSLNLWIGRDGQEKHLCVPGKSGPAGSPRGCSRCHCHCSQPSSVPCTLRKVMLELHQRKPAENDGALPKCMLPHF